MRASKQHLRHRGWRTPEGADPHSTAAEEAQQKGDHQRRSRQCQRHCPKERWGISCLLLSSHPLKPHKCPPLAASVVMGAWEVHLVESGLHATEQKSKNEERQTVLSVHVI